MSMPESPISNNQDNPSDADTPVIGPDSPHGPLPDAEPTPAETSRRIAVSNPVFFNGSGLMFWDTAADVRLLVIFEPEPGESEPRIVDLTEQLGEMVALGWPEVGTETGLFEQEPVVEVASVQLVGLSPDDRFYLVDAAECQGARMDVEFVTRAVAAGVYRMLKAAMADDLPTDDPPVDGISGDDVVLH